MAMHEDGAVSADVAGKVRPITFANADVLAFYRQLPFNLRESAAEHAAAIRRENAATSYPPLPPLLGKGTSVLDVGCGPGWLANTIAFHYGSAVAAIDFNPVAVERARAVAAALGVSVAFEVADLFLYEREPVDVVVSVGVLHHTDDCVAAVRRVCTAFVKPGGHALIGLYHAHGRRPFLDHFRAMRERGATEADMLARYRSLHSWLKDETQLVSWFRDQVLHPRETQHTLREMVPVLEDCGMRLVSTSINKFQPFKDARALYGLEPGYADLAAERLKAGTYFPGFFVMLARKE